MMDVESEAHRILAPFALDSATKAKLERLIVQTLQRAIRSAYDNCSPMSEPYLKRARELGVLLDKD